jgi:adhesin transport system membrane fusion protein
MIRANEQFLNDVRAALNEKAGARTWPIALGGVLVIAAGVYWASVSVLDEVTTGEGRVIPSSQTQVVQVLEGALISQLHVKTGDRVVAGQPLMRVDDTTASSQLGELKEKKLALVARRARLEAEARGLAPDFGAIESAAHIIAAENALFISRKASLDLEVQAADLASAQRQQEKVEAQVRIRESDRTLALLDRELTLARNLQARGVFPEIDMVRLDRQRHMEARDQALLTASLPRLDQAIAETQARRDTAILKFRATAFEELAKILAEVAVIDETLRAAEERLRRTVLRAPVNGIVNAIPVTTIGAVVQPGKNIIEIVPVDDSLLIEARVKPQDIAFVAAAQPASVKITAFDYTIYGDMKGKVERVGADTKFDDKGNPYYEVIIRTESNLLVGRDNRQLQIIPGMVTRVDILTGRKTVLQYIVRPMIRVRQEALRER